MFLHQMQISPAFVLSGYGGSRTSLRFDPAARTLLHCMDVTVRTGSTKAGSDLFLTSLELTSANGETVCFVLEVHSDEREAATVERESEMIIRHALLETEGDPSERLDDTLKEMNGLLKGMLVARAINDVHMLIGILDREGTLHVSHAGRAEAYLVRKGVASQITEYSGKPTPAFVHIASGALQPGDAVILSTQRLLRSLTPAQLATHASKGSTSIDTLIRTLETDDQHAALALMLPNGSVRAASRRETVEEDEYEAPVNRRRDTRRGSGIVASIGSLSSFLPSRDTMSKVGSLGRKALKKGTAGAAALPGLRNATFVTRSVEFVQGVLKDLKDPRRRQRAHLLILAGAIGALVVIWMVVQLFTFSERSKTRAELQSLIEQINTQLQTADNRRLMGDMDSANAILTQAEERAKQVMDNEAGLFRVDALNLLETIRSKREEINNILRLSPRMVANISAKSSDVLGSGMVGLGDGEFIVHDRQSLYRVLLNTVEDPVRLSDDVLILDGSNFSRFQSQAFLMTGNSVIEWNGNQATTMKTDDPKGWEGGVAISAYLRFLYMLSPEDNQIYKYERLTDRYGAPVGYNVNGDLKGALDMAIDGNVYVLKDNGTIVKLFRGETQPYVIRKAPDGLLGGATKIFKLPEGNMYALDSEKKRVVVISDGGAAGEASYLRQFVLEGEQLGTLKDLYVDPDEAHLYVMDEKRVWVIDLQQTGNNASAAAQ